MVSILAFDSATLKYLLHDRFDDYFTEEVPIFYKNKIAKTSANAGSVVPKRYYYQSAIDLALKNN